MTTNVAFHRSHARSSFDGHAALRYVVPVGRALFALIFIVAAFGHFSAHEIAFAAKAGVPLAGVAVPLSGVMSLAGGLSVLVGYRARIGAWILVAFLVPVTLMMHAFWSAPDPQSAMIQQIMFMKNVSMLGAALLIAYFGSGPISLDAKAGR
ncbi:MAG TPA: DoxX family protein [Polyangiaceae bacterium]|jgi:putative oxidoreductase|nr:DoxX family protein [Polyangiaceae bacterium]